MARGTPSAFPAASGASRRRYYAWMNPATTAGRRTEGSWVNPTSGRRLRRLLVGVEANGINDFQELFRYRLPRLGLDLRWTAELVDEIGYEIGRAVRFAAP